MSSLSCPDLYKDRNDDVLLEVITTYNQQLWVAHEMQDGVQHSDRHSDLQK